MGRYHRPLLQSPTNGEEPFNCSASAGSVRACTLAAPYQRGGAVQLCMRMHPVSVVVLAVPYPRGGAVQLRGGDLLCHEYCGLAVPYPRGGAVQQLRKPRTLRWRDLAVPYPWGGAVQPIFMPASRSGIAPLAVPYRQG